MNAAHACIDDLHQLRVTIHHRGIGTGIRCVEQHHEYIHDGAINPENRSSGAHLAPIPYLHRAPHAYREIRDATGRQLTMISAASAYQVSREYFRWRLNQAVANATNLNPRLQEDLTTWSDQALDGKIFSFQDELDRNDWRQERKDINTLYDIKILAYGALVHHEEWPQIEQAIEDVIQAAFHFRLRYFGYAHLHEPITPGSDKNVGSPGVVDVKYQVADRPPKIAFPARVSYTWHDFKNTWYGLIYGRYTYRTDIAFPWYGMTANLGASLGSGLIIRQVHVSAYAAAGPIRASGGGLEAMLHDRGIETGRLPDPLRDALADHLRMSHRSRVTANEQFVEANFHQDDITRINRHGAVTGIGLLIRTEEPTAAWLVSWAPLFLAVLAGFLGLAQALLGVAAAASVPYMFYALEKPVRTIKKAAVARYVIAAIAWWKNEQVAETLQEWITWPIGKTF